MHIYESVSHSRCHTISQCGTTGEVNSHKSQFVEGCQLKLPCPPVQAPIKRNQASNAATHPPNQGPKRPRQNKRHKRPTSAKANSTEAASVLAMVTFRELLQRVKSNIREVDVAAGSQMLTQGWTLLDVREPDEYEQGAIPGSVHIPRGLLESSVESRLADRATPIITMCAGGVRSAFAAATLAEMGYTDVASMDGGFNRWKDAGLKWQRPRTLTAEQRSRYSRHLTVPEVGEEGQLKLLAAKVLLLGAGGLGSPAALYLAASGVGTIGIIDMDEVDESNLQRQVLHNLNRLGERKVESAKKTLTALNSDVNVITYDTRLTADNALQILNGYDVIIDGADNFPTRYLLNDASVKLGIPVVHGSIFRFEGQVTVFDPLSGPTYRDMLPQPPPQGTVASCAEAGVLGVLPGIIGCVQALEAIKLIIGVGESLSGRLVAFDALKMTFQEFKLRPDPSNDVVWAKRDLIEVTDLDGLCSPAFSS